jgi:23S rRNA (adenine2503-C2)-methyltransferase
MQYLSDFDLVSLEALIAGWGFKPSHAQRMILDYYAAAGGLNLADLPLCKALLARLAVEIAPMQTHIIRAHQSNDGTVKLLIELADGQAVEAVLMPGHRSDRAAACISSQVGCAMGCDFCASSRGGLSRNLASGEIVEQFLHLTVLAKTLKRRITSLVFMGMGEPLHNLPNVIQAIDRIARPRMGNLGWRHITVSTVGLVPGIEELSRAEKPVYLALSLHAPDDETRSRIVPANRRWNVATVMDAAKRYQEKTGRITNIEYCLLRDINDSDAQAEQLAGLMRNFPAHVNIIPHNYIGSGISGIEYRKPAPDRVQRFLKILCDHGVVAHARVTRGDDIAAACGQLRQMSAEREKLFTLQSVIS